MSIVQQLLFYILIIILTFSTGFIAILLSKKQVENWIPKSFLLGTSILILVSFWISNIYSKGLREISKYLTIIILLIFIICVYIFRRKVRNYWDSIRIRDIVSCVVIFIAGSIPLSLIILFGTQFPYCDGYTYICNADYLMDAGYNVQISVDDMVMHPWLSQIYIYIVGHYRIGAQMLLAYLSGLVNLQFSIEMFLPLTSFGVALCGMGAWNVVSEKDEKNILSRITLIVFVCFNIPIIAWNAMYGFLPQTLGSALFLTIVNYYLRLEKWETNNKWHILTSAIVVSSFALTYNEMLPFFVLIVMFILFRVAVLNRKKIKVVFLNTFLSGILALAFIIAYVPGMIKVILSQLGAIVGWHQSKDINTYISYFLSIVPAEYSYQGSTFDTTMLTYQIITFIVSSIIIIGFYKSCKETKLDFLTIVISFLLVFFYFLFFTVNPFIGGRTNTWSLFKLIQYAFVPIAPFIGMFFAKCLENKKVLLSCFLVAFITINIINGIKYAEILSKDMQYYVGNQENAIQEYYELYNKYGNYDGIIRLENVPQKHRQMVTYFLKNTDLISDWNTDGYFGTIPVVDYSLIKSDITLIFDVTNSENIAGLVEIE